MRRPSFLLCALTLMSLLPLTAVQASARASSSTPRQSDVSDLRHLLKDNIRDERWLSVGARMWLNREADSGGRDSAQDTALSYNTPSFGTNVDANDPSKDLAAGQYEPAIAARSGHVMAAWSDLSGSLRTDSTKRRGSLIGVGYSNDAGRTFTDLIGLPNDDPNQRWAGAASVVAIDSGHFIVGGLYLNNAFACGSPGEPNSDLRHRLALSVATVGATGKVWFTKPTVTFTKPIVTADGGNLCQRDVTPAFFLDKPFLAYDPQSRTVVMSYTRIRFPFGQDFAIAMVRARVPLNAASLSSADFSDPITVWEEPSQSCLQAATCVIDQGSYPSVAPGGDTYIAWERNWISNLFNGDPYVYIHAALIPAGASAPSVGGKDSPRIVTTGQMNSRRGGVKSLDGVEIAGYNGGETLPHSGFGVGNDFPRIAVNKALRKVVVVWNDASAHPLGDIWLRALPLNLALTGDIHRVNDKGDYTLHFQPALSVSSGGAINVSWYDRRLGGPDSAITDYFGERRSRPGANGRDFRITTGSTDWSETSSFRSKFGEYTDNTTDGSKTYYAWTDGRLRVSQPFIDSR